MNLRFNVIHWIPYDEDTSTKVIKDKLVIYKRFPK